MTTRTPLVFRIIAPVTQQFGPNGRAHHLKRAAYVKEIREQAGWLAKAAGVTLVPPVRFRVTVGLLKRQVSQPMDQLNLHGHYGIKSSIDGLADVLTNGEDRDWHCIDISTVPDPANLGFIEIEIVDVAEIREGV